MFDLNRSQKKSLKKFLLIFLVVMGSIILLAWSINSAPFLALAIVVGLLGYAYWEIKRFIKSNYHDD